MFSKTRIFCPHFCSGPGRTQNLGRDSQSFWGGWCQVSGCLWESTRGHSLSYLGLGERREDGEAQQQGVLEGVPRDLPWPCSILLTGGVKTSFLESYSLRPELAGPAACLVGIGHSSRAILPPMQSLGAP